jgi:hypothetical protein
VRLRVLQGVLVVLVVIALITNLRKPHGIDPPPKRRPPSRVAAAPSQAADSAAVRLHRNIFEYVDRATPPPPAPMRAASPIPAVATASPTPAPVKLVGIVKGERGLRAALAVEGEVVLGSRGEKVRGYTILTIDEDTGVLLSGPNGEKLELRPVE